MSASTHMCCSRSTCSWPKASISSRHCCSSTVRPCACAGADEAAIGAAACTVGGETDAGMDPLDGSGAGVGCGSGVRLSSSVAPVMAAAAAAAATASMAAGFFCFPGDLNFERRDFMA